MRDKTIDDLTKSELLTLVKAMMERSEGFRWRVSAYIIDLNRKAELARIDEESRLFDVEIQLMTEINSVLLPYDGKPIGSIPMATLEQLQALNKKLDTVRKKRDRLAV